MPDSAHQDDPYSQPQDQPVDPEIAALIEQLHLRRLPVEGTLYVQTYRSPLEVAPGVPAGTAMLGLYCHNPHSISCFHRLTSDEVWHAYAGDPFHLILLHPNGSSEEVVMGGDLLAGQQVQFVVPAHTWQAGELLPGGRYALYGCTMVPGFSAQGFEAGTAEQLSAQYPQRAADIARLSAGGQETRMPDGFDGA